LPGTSNSLLATANFYSSDVSISEIFGSSSSGQYEGDGGSSIDVAIIAGPIVSGVAALTGLVIAGIITYVALAIVALALLIIHRQLKANSESYQIRQGKRSIVLELRRLSNSPQLGHIEQAEKALSLDDLACFLFGSDRTHR